MSSLHRAMSAGPPIVACSCKKDNECGGGTCTMATGQCSCGNTSCQLGETCKTAGAGDQCSCRGGAGCAGGQICCDVPTGCVNAQSDVNNCGGCGHVCPTGFNCINGGCGCGTVDANCDAGAPAGTMVHCLAISGPNACVCGTMQCPLGQRCQPDGKCG